MFRKFSKFLLIFLPFLALFAFGFFNVLLAEAAVYKIDPDHSSVSFKIRHIVSKTKGHFNDFSGTIRYDSANPKNSATKAKIQVKSIDTGVEKRDNHLRGEDFFHADKFPEMSFETTKVTKIRKKGKQAELIGNLTMHGITKPVVIDVEMTGIAKDPWGNERIGFSGSTKINRKDFNITWNMEGKGGGLILGDEVEIMLEIEGMRK